MLRDCVHFLLAAILFAIPSGPIFSCHPVSITSPNCRSSIIGLRVNCAAKGLKYIIWLIIIIGRFLICKLAK